MEIVIDIPEELYNRFGYEYREENLISKYTNDAILEAFCNGIPLPKGHGRLIDAYDMKDIEFINKGDYNSTRTIREWIDSAPTVIEAADKEQEEWVVAY